MHWNFIFYFPNPTHLILIALSSTCALKGKKKTKKTKKKTYHRSQPSLITTEPLRDFQ